MQTTLLGIAVAIILALLAALLGPAVIDWSLHRADIEAAASRLAGQPVRVNGGIDIRLLPTPRLHAENIVVGETAAPVLRVARADVEFSIGPLLRGQWRATEISIHAPQWRAALDANGALRQDNAALPSFENATLSVERLRIADGRIALMRENAPPLEIAGLSFDGEVRSLPANWRGEGEATARDMLWRFRIAVSRQPGEATARLRLALQRQDGALDIETDGALTWSGNTPRLEGNFVAGRAARLARGAADGLSDPWKLTARVAATPSEASLDTLEFLRGSEEGGQRLSGNATVQFAPAPRLRAVFSTRLLNLDRLVAETAPAARTPAEVTRALLAVLDDAGAWPAFDLSLSATETALGGVRLQALGLDLRGDGHEWSIARLEARGPGQTQAAFSGRLTGRGETRAFSGAADIQSTDMRALLAWIEARADAPTPSPGAAAALRLRGDIEASSERVALDRLRVTFDRDTVEGRLGYYAARAGQPARFEAFLTAPRLDLDAARQLAAALLPEHSALPEQWQVNVAAGAIRFFGVEARGLSARLRLDRDALDVAQFSLSDAEGVSLDATGRLGLAQGTPPGEIALDLRARNPAAVARLAEPILKQTPPPAALAAMDGPVRLTLRLGVAEAPAADRAAAPAGLSQLALDKRAARLSMQGQFGAWRGTLAAGLRPPYDGLLEDARAALPAIVTALDAKLEADEAGAFLRPLGLDTFIAPPPKSARPATLAATLAGEGTAARFTFALNAGEAMLAAEGRPDTAARALDDLALTLRQIDLRPALGLSAAAPAFPVSARATGAWRNGKLALTALEGSAAGTSLRGALDIDASGETRLSGRLAVGDIEMPAMLRQMLGMNAAPVFARDGTPSPEPFAAPAFATLRGELAFETPRATLAEGLAGSLRGIARFGDAGIVLADLESSFAGGTQKGEVRLERRGDARAVLLRAQGSNMRVEQLPAPMRALVDAGSFSLSADAQAEGRSLAALLGSISGSGQLTLNGATLRALDPEAFRAAFAFADAAPLLDAARLHEVAASTLARGSLMVKQAETTLLADAGVLRIAGVAAPGEGAALIPALRLDLARATIAGTLRLIGPSDPLVEGAPEIAVTLKGPAAAPQRSVDTALLSAWLTLRAVERQSRQLQSPPTASAPVSPPAPPPAQDAVTPTPARASDDVPAPSSIIREPDQPLLPPLPPPVEIKPAPRPAARAKTPAEPRRAPKAEAAPQNRAPLNLLRDPMTP